MNIKAALESINSFSELLPIIQQASAKLSCWNGRHVEIKGYEGLLDIDQLAAKVDAIFDPKAPFDLNENKCRREIVPLIIQVYKDSDKLYQDSGFVTKVVLFVRDIFLHIFCCHCIRKTDTRELWEYGIDRIMSGYGYRPAKQHQPWEPCLKRLCSKSS